MKRLLLTTIILAGCDPPPEAWEIRTPGGDPQLGLMIALLAVVVLYARGRMEVRQ